MVNYSTFVVILMQFFFISFIAREHTGNPKQPEKPLIRLRIDYTGFEPFSIYRSSTICVTKQIMKYLFLDTFL